MKTLTITSARQNPGAWLARAARGEEIGIISSAHVIALRPVAIAACAKQAGATVITTDLHFAKVPGLKVRAAVYWARLESN